jgi:hypothetical protein
MSLSRPMRIIYDYIVRICDYAVILYDSMMTISNFMGNIYESATAW